MGTAASASFFVIFGSLFAIWAVIVESQSESSLLPPPSSPPPPSPPLPPPYSPLPPWTPPPPPPPIPTTTRPPPPRRHNSKRPPSPRPKHEINTGKKVGLLFIGIIAIQQIGVVGFLLYKRHQLLKAKDQFYKVSVEMPQRRN